MTGWCFMSKIQAMHRFLLSLLLLLTLSTTFAHAGRVNMFIYHRFGEARYTSTNIDPKVFAAQLQYLVDQQIPVLSLEEVAHALQQGRSLPDKAVVLTVDDAFMSFLDIAYPLLSRYRFPVTLFVNTDSVGHPGYLNWKQLRFLSESGVTIGNHTASHSYLLDQHTGESISSWRERVVADIRKAQQEIIREIGVAPELFAYPYGEYSGALIDLVRNEGFVAAVAQQSGVVGEGSDRYYLPRFPMGDGFATLEGFRSKGAMAPLQLELLPPVDPVWTDSGSAPVLTVRLAPDRYELERLQGFVQGDNSLRIEPLPGKPGTFRVQADKPLSGRRNKYTLTVPLRQGGWAWFSQPWFRPSAASN